MDKNQREFLEQDPSAEEYVKTVDDFLNNLQLYTAQQETEFKAKQLERKNLLSKISYVENVLLQHLYNGDTKEEWKVYYIFWSCRFGDTDSINVLKIIFGNKEKEL